MTAPVVYANYGLPNDYDDLKKAGVDVKGKIVIVRYGNSFRGVKAKVAEDRGAIGCIIYSDPTDDGYMQAIFSERSVASGRVRPAWIGPIPFRLSRRSSDSGPSCYPRRASFET